MEVTLLDAYIIGFIVFFVKGLDANRDYINGLALTALWLLTLTIVSAAWPLVAINELADKCWADEDEDKGDDDYDK